LCDPTQAVGAALAPTAAGSSSSTENWSVLDSLIRTILSQNTTDKTSIRAFRALKERFPTYEAVLAGADADIEEAIRVGGLAAIKTKRIKDILQQLLDSHGACCLEHIRAWPTDDIKTFLSQFSGVGPKTVACVLMFALQRFDFPVDTHVCRITKQLGWCPAKATREQAYLHLNSRIPDDLKYSLHVQLVQHGKVCGPCSGKTGAKRKGECPLQEFKGRGGRGPGASDVAGGEVKVEHLPPDSKRIKSE
jgi:endonuclease III